MNDFLQIIKNILRSNLLTYKISLKIYGYIKSTTVKFIKDEIIIQQKEKKIHINFQNISYTKELIDYFDFYFYSIEGSEILNDLRFFPKSSFILKNFKYREKLVFPSVPTPALTSKTYLDVYSPEEGSTVIDLGSYAGVTLIEYLFTVGVSGYVLGVEADPSNYLCLKKNMEKFSIKFPEYKFDIVNAAITNHKNGVLFSSNHDMSSAVYEISKDLYQRKENLVYINSLNLSQLADEYNLDKIDLIKADIEGSELNALNDPVFFNNHNPKIILEPISLEGKNSLRDIISLLNEFNYKFKTYSQSGANAPLVLFFR